MQHRYDSAVNAELAQQQAQGVFQRSVCGVLKDLYAEALAELRASPKVSVDSVPAVGREALKAQLEKPFDGVIEEVILYALHKHRSSCALSNFTQEHNPDAVYLDAVIVAASDDWGGYVKQLEEWLSS